MTTTPAEAEASPESPATVPTLQDHAGKLAPLGWTGREAEWLALVALPLQLALPLLPLTTEVQI